MSFSYDKLRDLAKIIYSAQNNNWDFMTVVSGFEGVGKTTCAGDLIDEVKKLRGSRFDPVKDVVYSTDEFIKAVLNAQQFDCIMVDEGARAFYKMDFMKAETKEAVKLITQMRIKGLAVFICIPRFFDLLEYLRNARVSLWVDVIDRGHACLFQPDVNRYSDDRWHFK